MFSSSSHICTSRNKRPFPRIDLFGPRPFPHGSAPERFKVESFCGFQFEPRSIRKLEIQIAKCDESETESIIGHRNFPIMILRSSSSSSSSSSPRRLSHGICSDDDSSGKISHPPRTYRNSGTENGGRTHLFAPLPVGSANHPGTYALHREAPGRLDRNISRGDHSVAVGPGSAAATTIATVSGRGPTSTGHSETERVQIRFSLRRHGHAHTNSDTQTHTRTRWSLLEECE